MRKLLKKGLIKHYGSSKVESGITIEMVNGKNLELFQLLLNSNNFELHVK